MRHKMSHQKSFVLHRDCTVILTNAYFWPPNFEDKGFYCKICLIIIQIQFKFPFYIMSLDILNSIYTQTQYTHTQKHTFHTWSKYRFSGMLMLLHSPPFCVWIVDIIYLNFTKHDNVWNFCRKKINIFSFVYSTLFVCYVLFIVWSETLTLVS